MRISDWSSDVCSSDLIVADHHDPAHHVGMPVQVLGGGVHDHVDAVLQRALHPGRGEGVVGDGENAAGLGDLRDRFEIDQQIGRASCRERECTYGEVSWGAVSFTKTKYYTLYTP